MQQAFTRHLLLPCTLAFVFILSSCGGNSSSDGGSTEPTPVTFGGAACESGATFANGSAQGYDSLYNYERNRNQNIQVTFDPSSQPQECVGLISADQVIPWVRVDFQDQFSADSSELSFELVAPGGRNSTVLATYAIPDSSKQSAHGTFSYEIAPSVSSVYSDVTCQVSYDGSYCPRTTGSQDASGSTNYLMDFSAEGTINCTLKHANGTADTTCRGDISATNVTLEGLYYGV